MALVKYSPNVRSVSGPIGGVVFKRHTGSGIVGTRPDRILKTSQQTLLIHTLMEKLEREWESLSAEEIWTWGTEARKTKRTNRFGIERNIGGREHFFSINILRIQADLPTIETPLYLIGQKKPTGFDIVFGLFQIQVTPIFEPPVALSWESWGAAVSWSPACTPRTNFKWLGSNLMSDTDKRNLFWPILEKFGQLRAGTQITLKYRVVPSPYSLTMPTFHTFTYR